MGFNRKKHCKRLYFMTIDSISIIQTLQTLALYQFLLDDDHMRWLANALAKNQVKNILLRLENKKN